MAVVVDYTDKVTADDTPVLEGTCGERHADITAIVRAGAVTGGDDDTFNTKAIGGQWAVATEALERATAVTFASSKIADDNRYLMEPQQFRLNSGKSLTVFRRGSEHASNDGRIFSSRSSDNALTNEAEVLVHDHVSGYDTRNQAGGVDPDTGRVWVFMSIYDYDVTVTRQDVGVVYSDDEGDTWSSYTSLITEFPPAEQIDKNVVPFGEVFMTSKGLMQLFYYHEDCWALILDPDTQTWGGRIDIYTGSTPVNSIGEPRAVRVDNDRIVVVLRDNIDQDSFRYLKTDDAFTTNTGVSEPTAWTTLSMTAAAPFDAKVYRGQVLGAITGRGPDWDLHTSRTALEDFWEYPPLAWSEANLYRLDAVYNATTLVNIDWGYASFLPMDEYPDTALIMFYDRDGAALDVSIYSLIMGVV